MVSAELWEKWYLPINLNVPIYKTKHWCIKLMADTVGCHQQDVKHATIQYHFFLLNDFNSNNVVVQT